MNTIETTTTDLKEGLFVLELEERLEMAALTAAVASSQRCDIELEAL
jgi:hypothetical protein